MARTFDPYVLHAKGALIDWAVLARSFLRGGLTGSSDFGKPGLHLRWLVSDAAGIPPEPFVVWGRLQRDEPGTVDTTSVPVDGYRAEVLPEPMLTVEVDAEPFSPGQPMVLWGFADVPSLASINSVATATSSGQVTLRIRAGGIVAFVLWHGSVAAVRGASVVAALAEKWEELEIVGLPVDGSWAGSMYTVDDQGPVAALSDPATAAADRLGRGLPPFGWQRFTETGRAVVPWFGPDRGNYVAETQHVLLEQARSLFDAGVVPARQSAVRRRSTIRGPATALGHASGPSTSEFPALDVLLVAAGSDPAAALALGFGTAYPIEGLPKGQPGVAGRDVMVSAHYAQGHLGDGVEEDYAAIVPWPSSAHTPPNAPTGLVAERAGLLTPADATAPWRETLRVDFDAIPPSVSLERPVSAAFAAYEPASATAKLLLEEDATAGGYRSLLLSARPAPHTDQVALVDSGETDLPLDLSARVVGHAVAVQDHYGLWSPWRDVEHSGAAPAYPIPQVVAARLDTSYEGSTTCPLMFVVDVVVDWQIREPLELEIRAVLCPVGDAGADLPPGVDPYAAAPPGCTRWDVSVPFSGDVADPPDPAIAMEYLAADAESMVDPGDAGFPRDMHGPAGDTRRYRVTVMGATVDFAASAHYAASVWARERTTAAPALWGDVAATPVVARVGSPVPPVVAFVAPPAVPLGSIPDAGNRSHVRVSTNGITGAAKITVWSASEAALRAAGGLDPHPDRHDTLPVRYQTLQEVYDALAPSRRRAVFTRYGTFDPSTESVDVALPRGSTEIHLFAVSAVNAAGVESAWSGSHAGLQAAAAPRLVRPTVPELSAAPDPSSGSVDLTVSAGCPLPVVSFEIHATRLPDAAADVGSMGPPLQTIPVVEAPSEPDAAGGPMYTASVPGLAVGEDWRPFLIRAVAVPAAVENDSGTYGARSGPSPVASVAVPPSEPPDLSALTVDGWGAGDHGISVEFASRAPVAPTTFGPHMLGFTARDASAGPGDPALFSVRSALAALDVDTSRPPAGAAAGTLARGPRAGGQTPYGAWFQRPTLDTVVDVEVVLTDPLGRVSVRNYQVPSGLLDPPVVTITDARAQAGLLIVDFTTDAPAGDATGPYVLDVTAAEQRILWPFLAPRRIPMPGEPEPAAGRPFQRFPPFPPFQRTTLQGRFALPDVRDAGRPAPQPADVDAVRVGAEGPMTAYTVWARMAPPAVMTVAITTPRGLVGSARGSFSAD